MDEKTRALLEELRAKPGPWLLATDVAPVMRWNPQCVRLKGQRGDLPFPAEAHGCRSTKKPFSHGRKKIFEGSDRNVRNSHHRYHNAVFRAHGHDRAAHLRGGVGWRR